MIPFTLGNKKIKVASSWDDLTFNQYMSILNGPLDTIKAISICSGIKEEDLRKAKVIVGLEDLINAIKFLSTPPKFDGNPIQIGKYKLPLDSKGEFNPQFKRLDQYEDMRKAMVFTDKGIVSVTEAYATYCAIYLQEIRDGDYSFDKAKAMVSEVKEMPAKEVIAAGSFFLIKLWSLQTGIIPTSPNTTRNRKKSKPVSKTSKRNSGRTPRSRKSRSK